MKCGCVQREMDRGRGWEGVRNELHNQGGFFPLFK